MSTTTGKKRRTYRYPTKHEPPTYLKEAPYYLVKIPWVVTSGSPKCPCEFYNGTDAAVHSLLAAMRMSEVSAALQWLKTARRQVNQAIREIQKPGAQMPVKGQVYPDPDLDYPPNKTTNQPTTQP